MSGILIAIKRTLSDRRYLAGWVVITAVIFSALFLIQVKTVPGNSGALQIAIFGWKDWIILTVISILNALFITIEIYVFNLKREFNKLNGVGSGLITGGVGPVRGRGALRALAASFEIGTSSGVLASIFSTASCSLCASAIFGFLGANSVVFLVNNRRYVVVGTLFLLLLSLYLSSKRFSETCKQCQIKL